MSSFFSAAAAIRLLWNIYKTTVSWEFLLGSTRKGVVISHLFSTRPKIPKTKMLETKKKWEQILKIRINYIELTNLVFN